MRRYCTRQEAEVNLRVRFLSSVQGSSIANSIMSSCSHTTSRFTKFFYDLNCMSIATPVEAPRPARSTQDDSNPA